MSGVDGTKPGASVAGKRVRDVLVARLRFRSNVRGRGTVHNVECPVWGRVAATEE